MKSMLKVCGCVWLFLGIAAICLADVRGPYMGQEPPGLVPEIFAPGLISVAGRFERAPNFSPDGNEFYFTIILPDHTDQDIYYSICDANGNWSDPEEIYFSVGKISADVSLTSDGNRLCFTSNEGNSEFWDNDIWVSERVGGWWAEPTILSETLNTTYGEWGPCLLANGTVYFARTLTGSNSELYRSRFIDGAYETPIPVSGINSPSSVEYDQTVPDDESYMFFKSNRSGGYGGNDLYSSFNNGGTWSTPKNLGPVINTPYQDDCGNLTPDGKYFMFARREGDTEMDIYWVDARAIFPVGDFTRDGKVNFNDFAVLTDRWLTDEPSVDITPDGGDGIVDMNDLGLFADSWLRPIFPGYVPPSAPTGFVATAGNLQVSLDWDDNDEDDLNGYNVYRSESSGSGYSKINSSLVTSSDYIDDTVTVYTTYYYVVTAVDMSFNESGYSNEDSATPYDATPPAPPTDLLATAGDGTVSLDWLDSPEGDLDGYNIHRSTTSGSGYSQLNGSLLSNSFYTDINVTNEITYYYVVTAVDIYSNESGYSNEASATPSSITPTIYNFEGINQANTEYNAYACDVDTFPFGGSSANRNAMVEATDQQYINISANNTAEWATADAGFFDQIFLWVEMKINETPDDINRIDLTFNGNTSGPAAVTHSIYVLKAGTDWKQNSNWVQVGSDMDIEPGVDTMMSRTISSDFSTYIDGGTGRIIWGVYETTSSEVMNINYLEMTVNSYYE